MTNFISLNAIVNDILFIARGARVSQAEPITRIQIEYWVHQYRNILIKQDIDKGRSPCPAYIQEIPAIKLVKIDRTDPTSSVTSGKFLYVTEIEIPDPIDLNYKTGLTWVGTIDGKEIQLVSQGRAEWQQYKKFTGRDTIAYIKGSKIYIEGDDALSYIAVRGIFEIPTEVNLLVNPTVTQGVYNNEDNYPVPGNMVPIIKQMILKNELGIMTTAPSDTTNDASSKVESNVEQQQRQ